MSTIFLYESIKNSKRGSTTPSMIQGLTWRYTKGYEFTSRDVDDEETVGQKTLQESWLRITPTFRRLGLLDLLPFSTRERVHARKVDTWTVSVDRGPRYEERVVEILVRVARRGREVRVVFVGRSQEGRLEDSKNFIDSLWFGPRTKVVMCPKEEKIRSGPHFLRKKRQRFRHNVGQKEEKVKSYGHIG